MKPSALTERIMELKKKESDRLTFGINPLYPLIIEILNIQLDLSKKLDLVMPEKSDEL